MAEIVRLSDCRVIDGTLQILRPVLPDADRRSSLHPFCCDICFPGCHFCAHPRDHRVHERGLDKHDTDAGAMQGSKKLVQRNLVRQVAVVRQVRQTQR